jgi:hypothetical protein
MVMGVGKGYEGDERAHPSQAILVYVSTTNTTDVWLLANAIVFRRLWNPSRPQFPEI